ncbi:MAG: alpha/beta hydrolase [Clostridia bacterium]|nr:alpha/beta hydrolase [Clostridia bacterium]
MTAFARKKKLWITLSVILTAVIALTAAVALYLGDYYRADLDALEAFVPAAPVVSEEWKDGTLITRPEGRDPIAGLIFYPGGKVEHTAYTPLMEALASEGILCVLVEMPFRLAVLDKNAAEGISEAFPEVEHWYMGGHSLGGSMAASYLSSHTEDFDGLILLGAYSTADLSGTELSVLSVYGSEDGVLNREKYAEYRPNLPEGFTETVIEGGNHAFFGAYGEQDGDGTATVTPAEQVRETVAAILSMLEVSP